MGLIFKDADNKPVDPAVARKRADWAAGRIRSASVPHAKSYLTVGIALCVIGGLIAGGNSIPKIN
jgi:hypothetical protein